MQNLKIRVSDEAEAEEAQELFFELGATLGNGDKHAVLVQSIIGLAVIDGLINFVFNEIVFFNIKQCKETNILELRAMVNPMKEYLDENRNYKFLISTEKDDGFIEIPEGAEAFGYTGIVHTFYKDDFRSFFNENTDGQWDGRSETWVGMKEPVILWQRYQDEPFLTPECTLNDQYAEIEQVRQQSKEIYRTSKAEPDFSYQYLENKQVQQAIKVKSGSDSDHALDSMSFGLMGFGAAQAVKDNVNHPIHYTQGKVECIDVLESATIGKSGIEAVCVANVIKYLWRYEEKNGLEDVKKAKFYLNRLLATLENDNG